MRARLIGRPEGRAEAIRQLRDVAVRDERVAQRLLLLFRERQQGGLAYDARLNPAGDGVIGRERRFAFRALRKGRDRRQALEDDEVDRGLSVGPGAGRHQDENADQPKSLHGAAPP